MSKKRQDDLLLTPPVMTHLPRPVYVRAQTLAAGSYFAAHQHEWIQFLYAISGMLRISLPTGSFTVPPRYAVWIPAGVQHQVSAQGEVNFRSLYIDVAADSTAAAASLAKPCRVVEVTPLARELIIAAAALPPEYEEHGRAGRLVATLLDELLDLEETGMFLPMPTDARLKRICDSLLKNPGDTRELEDWAASIHVSTRTLARLFVSETSMGFRQWRQRLRLCRALELLASGHNVTTVALEIGYNSSSAFIAAFREQFGKAPGEFMRIDS
jgi:AraC-like DNA-binding protein